ncbi:hypothetical protein BDN72DRAFT_840707 [Pluteus cervinus]|uniref:Uncharacterized protein n=1 Tax=Pluteus cervinus TaxID=181527 RepID=A0ACD3AVD7_9AGAR|nr:hypothetical protein BDN72DRAFT_840707 [Pluteus cervinus]
MPPRAKKQKKNATDEPSSGTSTSKKGKAKVTPEASTSNASTVASTSAGLLKRVDIKQTAKIFELSIEVFMEILSYFPASPIPTRVSMALLPPSSTERTEILRALSQTCQSFRDIFLDMLWQRVEVCTVKVAFAKTGMSGKSYMVAGEDPAGAWYIAISDLLLTICKGLVANPSYAPRVQIFNAAITRCNSEAVLGSLVRCLKSLPNLHTLQIYRAHTQMTTHFKITFEGHLLPQIRTIILPTYAHNVLRCCPNVTTVVCNGGDGSQLISAIQKVCKKIEVMDGFPLGDTRLVKRIPKAAPTLRILRMYGRTTPELRTILSPIKDLQLQEIVRPV